ncbi:dihydropteroate synthase [Algoriphagus namhaensis]
MNTRFKVEDNLFPQKFTFNAGGRLLLWDEPQVMGIVNLTPDSFYAGSRVTANAEHFEQVVERMLEDGADILDLGGYSSRPGATDISIKEETERVIPAIRWIRRNFPHALISIDTFRSEVAKMAVEEGANLVNDISAGNLDPTMLKTISALKVPYIAMHMKGNPRTMQRMTDYSDPVGDILDYFSEKLEEFKNFGINDVIIDVGFGFAKTIEQNFVILRRLAEFKVLGKPILAGISRKSMIYKTLGTGPEAALNGTTALHMFALCNGAKLLRVHDVKEAKETIELYKKLYP